MASPLAQFRAGLLVKDGLTLKPDPRKGLIRVIQDAEDLLHFQWAERTAAGALIGDPQIDLVVFPGEASFERIQRPGSRVFTLKFPAEPDRSLFFWAQEPAAESDAANVSAVHAALSAVLDGMEAEESGPPTSENPRDPSATPAGGAPAPSAPSGIGASQLAAALGSILAGAPPGAAPQGLGPLLRAASGPSLGEVLRAERVVPLLQDPALVARLAPYLPEEHRSAAAMADIVNSPQFKAQLEALSGALASGALDASQFGLGAPAYGVAEFLKAIQRQADQEKAEQQGKQGQEGSGGGGANA